jgi:hypothetical protein
MKQEEITKERYYEIDSALKQAEQNLMAYHKRNGRPWVTSFHYFYSSSSQPCIYQDNSIIPCIFTGEKIKNFRKKPKSFRDCIIGTYKSIKHFTPKGCPNLTVKDYVLCLVEDYKTGTFFFGKHKVGECPHKKVTK